MGPQWVYGRGHRTPKTVFRAVVLIRVLGLVVGSAWGGFLGYLVSQNALLAGVHREAFVMTILFCVYVNMTMAPAILGMRDDDHQVRALLWRWAGHRLGGPWTHRFLRSRPALWGIRRAPWVTLVVSAAAVGVWGGGPMEDWFGLSAGVIVIARATFFVIITGTAVLLAVLAISLVVGLFRHVIEDMMSTRPVLEQLWPSVDALEMLPPGLFRKLALGWLVAAVGSVLALVVDSEPFRLAVLALLGAGAVGMAAWVTVTVGNISQRYGIFAPIAAVVAAVAIESEMTPFDLSTPVSTSIVTGNLMLAGFTAVYAAVGALDGHRARAGVHVRRARAVRAGMLDQERRHETRSMRASSWWVLRPPLAPLLLRTFGAEYAAAVIWVHGPSLRYEHWWEQLAEHYTRCQRPPGATLYVLSVAGPGSLRAGVRQLQELCTVEGPVVRGRDTVGFLVTADYLARVGPKGFQRLVEEEWPTAGARWFGPDRVGISDRALRMHLHL